MQAYATMLISVDYTSKFKYETLIHVLLMQKKKIMQEQDSVTGSADHRITLVHEMSAHNFDLIRFASYRTSMKLRFIQKKVNCKYDAKLAFFINILMELNFFKYTH